MLYIHLVFKDRGILDLFILPPNFYLGFILNGKFKLCLVKVSVHFLSPLFIIFFLTIRLILFRSQLLR